MPQKKVPPCALVAGDAPDSPAPGLIVIIALVFGFETCLLVAGVEVVTAVVLVASGVLIASLATVKPKSVADVVKQIAALLHLLPGTVTP
jgi:hypothetical protein